MAASGLLVMWEVKLFDSTTPGPSGTFSVSCLFCAGNQKQFLSTYDVSKNFKKCAFSSNSIFRKPSVGENFAWRLQNEIHRPKIINRDSRTAQFRHPLR
jgi:hypothetical protein